MSSADHPQNWDFKPYRVTVANILNRLKPASVLDIACGEGWIKKCMLTPVKVHGLDFYTESPPDYDLFTQANLDQGIPATCGQFDVAVCCEAITYLQNLGVFFSSVHKHIKPGGCFVISLPNPIYGASRVDQVIQGFPRANNYFVQPVADSHMPWLPLNFYQLWFVLGINGFSDIKVHDVDEPKPKHFWERIVGAIAKSYIRRRLKKSKSEHERILWTQALSDQLIYGRRLVISAIRS